MYLTGIPLKIRINETSYNKSYKRELSRDEIWPLWELKGFITSYEKPMNKFRSHLNISRKTEP